MCFLQWEEHDSMKLHLVYMILASCQKVFGFYLQRTIQLIHHFTCWILKQYCLQYHLVTILRTKLEIVVSTCAARSVKPTFLESQGIGVIDQVSKLCNHLQYIQLYHSPPMLWCDIVLTLIQIISVFSPFDPRNMVKVISFNRFLGNSKKHN